MSSNRRQFLAASFSLVSCTAGAQSTWPTSKPIRVIVPFPAGGQTDIAARVVGQALGDALKHPVVVDNKPGAHGFIGGSEVARAPADGYTLLVGSTGSTAINPKLYDKMPYDAVKDFAPVSLLMMVPIVVVVNPRLPVETMPELVSYLKANPGKVNFASAGTGASSHLVGEYLKFKTETSMTHIPYKGQAPAIADVIAGHAHVMFDTLLSCTPHIKNGKVRILATTSRERLPEYPGVPTVAESLQLKDFEASSWSALHAPAGTPQTVIQRLSTEIDNVLRTPSVFKRLMELGGVPVGGTPQRLADFQRSEEEKWGDVIRTANIKPE